MHFLTVHREDITSVTVLLAHLILYIITEEGTPRLNYIPKEYLYQYAYPVLPQTVPNWEVLLLVSLVPTSCFCAHKLLNQRPWRDVFRLVLALAMSVLLTACITNLIKLNIARPRPNFVSKCWPSLQPAWLENTTYGGYPDCETPASVYNQHLKSFPSGHSSVSSSGLGFLTYFLLGQTKAFAGGGHVWRGTLSLLPALGALAIAVSRVFDYWHHPTDVITGLLLGFVISYAMYRQLYPGWTSPDCCQPLYEQLPRKTPCMNRSASVNQMPSAAASPLLHAADVEHGQY